jgi:hypothetical protein
MKTLIEELAVSRLADSRLIPVVRRIKEARFQAMQMSLAMLFHLDNFDPIVG